MSNLTDFIGDNTAADILAKIKTVDGSGSGLDADMVDGVQGALLGIGGAGYAIVDEGDNRASGTTYTNTDGKPIAIILTSVSSSTQHFKIDGANVATFSASGHLLNSFFIVPSGSTYELSGGDIGNWIELK